MATGKLHQSRGRSCEECNRKKAKCDKKSPKCHRCQQSGSRCVYPTHRKRTTLETKYQSLRRKLMESNQGDELEGLLDNVDLNVLRGALRRREHQAPTTTTESGSSPSDKNATMEAQGNADYQLQQPQDMSLSISSLPLSMVADAHNPPTVLSQNDGSVLEHLQVEVQDSSPSHDPSGWFSNMTFSPFTDSYGMFSLLNSTERYGDAWSGSAPSLSEDLNLTDRSPYTLAYPPALIDELIDLFFLRLQLSIPIFHEPRFRQKFHVDSTNNDRYARLSIEDALILTAMMALSARFSTNEFFPSTCASKDKGKVFARKANALYAEALQSDERGGCDDGNEISLGYLQGCILLAFYEQTNRITTQSWLLIGTCCRLAIDLGLNELDRDVFIPDEAATSSTAPPAEKHTQRQQQQQQYEAAKESWVQKEEKRRAWWLVWELDVFAATILRRPHSINKDQMNVLLPVSDATWFSEMPTESILLRTDFLHEWQTLESCPTADERAWFLVTTLLMARAADLAAPENTFTLQDVVNFGSTLNCFALLLPQGFQLDIVRTPFTEANIGANNWALLTVFMLHTARVLVRNAQYIKSQSGMQNSAVVASLPTGPHNDTYLVFRAMEAWPPEYLIYACPFVSCTIVGPAFDNIRAALLFEPGGHGNYLSMLKLILKRIGAFWGIGESALRLVEIFEHEIKANGSFRQQAFQKYAKDFSLLVVDPARNA
ncbi:hypothetical protein AYL99_10516 [Fonsecaea erecta]|uniref:Zn(2)-C6 fungal-type domain-containing protein n=1 Tax=Fonsecaea erecta TaxID=1367422 RepID=A0A178Z8P0_9EURO|nr:hypothetical protein AYL99_10516 [Fonsecaea erecta]OAP55543.1 hypothetical protein AYL99_10516 [Fonsecaea erecta]